MQYIKIAKSFQRRIVSRLVLFRNGQHKIAFLFIYKSVILRNYTQQVYHIVIGC